MRLRFSPKTSRAALLMWLVYSVLIGGALYADSNIFILGFNHLLMTAVLGFWLWGLIRRGENFPRSALDLPLLAYVIWLGVAALASQDSRVSLEQSWPLLIHVLLFYWFVWLIERGRARWLFEGLFLIAALVVVISLAEFASWYFGLGFAGFGAGWFAVGGLTNPIPPVIHRLSLALNVSTWNGNFVVLTLPLVWGWSRTARRRADRQALFIVALGLIWVWLFSVSRGAFLGLAAALGLMLAFAMWRRWAVKLSSGQQLALISAGLIAGLMMGAALLFFLTQDSGRSSGDQGRLTLWRAASEMIGDYPLTGVGVYQYGYFQREYGETTSTTSHLKSAHNLYLNSAAEIGLPALLLLAALTAAFLWAWWREWRGTYPERRIRLEAILGAAAGFAVQSLVDNFMLTATVLPLLLGVAYAIKPINRARLPQIKPRPYRLMAYPALLILLGFFLWLMSIDLAHFRFFQSSLAIGREDYTAALTRIEQAQNLDPNLRAYDLQAAQILGLLAYDDPNEYLSEAIQAYESALANDPYFEVGHANLAGLYAQNGDYVAALASMERAAAIHDPIRIYRFNIGLYHEILGDEAAAQAAYESVLAEGSLYVASDFWGESGYPAREAALEAVYANRSSAEKLFFAVDRHWEERATQVAENLSRVEELSAYAALGYYAMWRGDYTAAAEAYRAALNLSPPDPWLEAALARAYLELGQTEDAEYQARRALFLDSSRVIRRSTEQRAYGVEAHYVLARLWEAEGRPAQQINDRLARAVVPKLFIRAYEDVVFRRVGRLEYLPQVVNPGYGERAYEAWFWLAERYAADDDPDTDPTFVYQAILNNDPHLERARELCGADCAE